MPVSETLRTKIQMEVKELSDSINGIVETFRSMRSPLVESREKVPQATVQLDKIADQTEAAAHLMLDKIEEITQREEDVIRRLKELPGMTGSEESQSPVAEILNLAQTNLDDVYMVMDALQFQDITTQQIQHAAAMLEEIEAKLQRIVSIVTGDDDAGNEPHVKTRVYDPHADFVDRKADQSDVDSMFDKAKK